MDFQTEKSNLGLPKGKGVVGINWELGIKRHTLYIQNSRWEEKGTTGWDGWVASPTPWTWVWASPGSWWWTGRPGVLRSMGSQRVRHDWVPEKQLYKIDSKWGPTVYHTELYSASCNCLWWRRIWKRNIYLFLHFLTSLVEFILCNLGKVKGRPKLFCRPEAGDMGLCVCVNVTCVCLSVPRKPLPPPPWLEYKSIFQKFSIGSLKTHVHLSQQELSPWKQAAAPLLWARILSLFGISTQTAT